MKLWSIVVVVLSSFSLATCTTARSDTAVSVSYERLLHADDHPGDWLTYSGAYNGQRFSGLSEITRENVGTLKQRWVYPIDTRDAVETTPLVVDGVMYFTQPPNDVVAVDATTGQMLWTFHWPISDKLAFCCGKVNRGLAILNDTLYLGTLDAHLVAISTKTGAKQWAVQVADPRSGFSITGAPLIVKDLIITGMAIAQNNVDFTQFSKEHASLLTKDPELLLDPEEVYKQASKAFAEMKIEIKSRIYAYDATTGTLRWSFDTVPGPGQPGHETWPNDYWKIGSAGAWMTGSYDPTLNIIYWGVGNPSGSSFGALLRKGDNLFSCSLLALNADTGKLVWHYQFTPNDVYDWDAAHVPVLVDRQFLGRDRKLVMVANRNAYFYGLDRESGELLVARPYARQSWSEKIDTHGRPIFTPNSRPNYAGITLSPTKEGATNWWSPSYSPRTGLFYVTAHDGTEVRRVPPVNVFTLNDPEVVRRFAHLFVRQIEKNSLVSAVRAIVPETGEIKWEFQLPPDSTSGLLSTAGDVLFAGSSAGDFFALDTRSGNALWHGKVLGRVHAAPITYLAGGRQYVAVASNGGIHAFELAN